MSSESPAVYLFGDFRLDPANHRLQRSGELVTLAPKAFQLLVLLVERVGTLVTKEELIDTLWPDVVVQENNLTQQVSLIRKVLGEGEWIETLPRVGYRFIGAVTRDASRLPAIRAVPAPRDRNKLAIAASLLIILAVATMVWKRSEVSGATKIRSLAVLPLRPIGNSQDVLHLGVGIADAVIHHLSSIPSLDVRPTSAVRKFAGTNYDSRAAARELEVDAVLEGTIQREKDRVRIRVQLVDLRRNVPIFSGKFDEPASDLFAIEDLVADATTRALALETAGGNRARAEKRRSREPGAYEAYLKGRYEWSKRTGEGMKASLAYYEEAIDRDRSYAAAYAALGDSLNLLSIHRVALPSESFPQAKEAAKQALAIDETIADAHVTLGTAAFYYDWNWGLAEKHLRRAIELDSRQSSARHILANLYLATGRVDEGLDLMKEARLREPFSVALLSASGFQHYLARRNEASIKLAHQALDRDSTFAQAYGVIGLAHLSSGNYDDGVAALERKADLLNREGHAVADLAIAYAMHPAGKAKALAMVPGLLELVEKKACSPYDLARFYSALGDKKEALRWLDETRRLRDPGMVWLALEPRLDPIRGEPRYRQLLAEMNLVDADKRLSRR